MCIRPLLVVVSILCSALPGVSKDHISPNQPSIVVGAQPNAELFEKPATAEEMAAQLAVVSRLIPRGDRDAFGAVLLRGVLALREQADFRACLSASEQSAYGSLAQRLATDYGGRAPARGSNLLRPARRAQSPAGDIFGSPNLTAAFAMVDAARLSCGATDFGLEGEDGFQLDLPARPDDDAEIGPEQVANYTMCLEERATWAQTRCQGPTASNAGSGSSGPFQGGRNAQAANQVFFWALSKVVKAGLGAPVPDVAKNPHPPGSAEWEQYEQEKIEAEIEIDTALANLAETIATVIWEFFFGVQDAEECAPSYQFASAHPLSGATYQMGGTGLGANEMLMGCVCHLSVTHLGESNPDTPWDCKSEAEQRRDCARNPYTPDDAPRLECIGFLYSDAGASPPEQCVNALCPAGYVADAPGLCSCKLDTSFSATPPVALPADPNACAEIQCGPGRAPVPVEGGTCVCQAFGQPEPGNGPDGPGQPLRRRIDALRDGAGRN